MAGGITSSEPDWVNSNLQRTSGPTRGLTIVSNGNPRFEYLGMRCHPPNHAGWGEGTCVVDVTLTRHQPDSTSEVTGKGREESYCNSAVLAVLRAAELEQACYSVKPGSITVQIADRLGHTHTIEQRVEGADVHAVARAAVEAVNRAYPLRRS